MAEGTSLHVGLGPVGQGDYVVQPGDCMLSIAQRAGHAWQTIWDHPSNADLKAKRKDPNLLLPADRLFIPTIRLNERICATDKLHIFELQSVPAKLRLQIFKDEKPRKGEKYRLEVDGCALKEGTLDNEGRLEAPISPSAATAALFVGEGHCAAVYSLRLGGVDPITEISGMQQRLRNLGYNCQPNGHYDDVTRAALAQFQELNSLEPSGEYDDATRTKLHELHGC